MKKIYFLVAMGLSINFLGCANKPQQSSPQEVNREIAAAIENGKYFGVAKVSGRLSLKSENGSAEMISGPVTAQLSSVNFFRHPVKRIQGERFISIESAQGSFSFRVPKELIFENGTISVGPRSAQQNANIVINEAVKKIRSYEEEGTVSCSYSGMCFSCGGIDVSTGQPTCGTQFSASCPGSEKVLFRVDLLNRSLKIQIYNKEGSATIETSEKRDIQKEEIKSLSSCG